MTTSAKVLADSMGPEGDRLTTLEVTFPRFILAEQARWGVEREFWASRAD